MDLCCVITRGRLALFIQSLLDLISIIWSARKWCSLLWPLECGSLLPL